MSLMMIREGVSFMDDICKGAFRCIHTDGFFCETGYDIQCSDCPCYCKCVSCRNRDFCNLPQNPGDLDANDLASRHCLHGALRPA